MKKRPKAAPMLIDTHAHLHVKEFDEDREEVLKRAFSAGVEQIINVGFDAEGNFQALALAKKYPEVIFATMGIHPHLADQGTDYVLRKIFETAEKDERVVALGEMGLDFFKNFQPRETQIKTFRAQLLMARELDLPVIIHCRDAFSEALKILKEEELERVNFHCFTGSTEIAEKCWERGYLTSFTGIITYPHSKELQEVVARAPKGSFMIETDCPFLAPQGYRGKRNEPGLAGEIFDKIVEIRGEDPVALEEEIQTTTQDFFEI